jgi:hypothetical protein
MNDLRRILLWLSVLGILAIGVWGLEWDERSGERPFAPQYREFRQNHRLEILGYVFYVPLARMLCAWGAVICAAAALWPLATPERSRSWLGEWERPEQDAPWRAGRR